MRCRPDMLPKAHTCSSAVAIGMREYLLEVICHTVIHKGITQAADHHVMEDLASSICGAALTTQQINKSARECAARHDGPARTNAATSFHIAEGGCSNYHIAQRAP